jgi:hypothetical protein
MAPPSLNSHFKPKPGCLKKKDDKNHFNARYWLRLSLSMLYITGMDGDFKRRGSYADMVTSRHRQTTAPINIQSSETVSAKAVSSKRKKHGKKLLLVGIIVVITTLGIALAYFLVASRQNHTPIDDYARQSDFSLYYPDRLPEDYEVATTSIASSRLKSRSNKPTITVTQQAMPANLDADRIVGKDAPAAVRAQSGTLYNIGTGEQGRYMLITSGTLIFFSTNSKINTEMANSLADDLKPVR